MGNCLKTQLKQVVDNDNLDYLGWITVDVDTTGLSNPSGLYFLDLSTGQIVEAPVGCRLIDGKTFANGKTIIEQGDQMKFPAGDTYKLLIPKYNTPLISGYYTTGNGLVKIDLDELQYIPQQQEMASDAWLNTINFNCTASGLKSKGHIKYVLNLFNPSVITKILMGSTDIVSNINEDRFSDFYKLTSLDFSNNSAITGNIRTYLTSLSSKNASELKARTNDFYIRVGGSNINNDVFSSSGLTYICLKFNGTSNITIQCLRVDGVTVIKTFNYNIDTDTLIEQ